jgi:SAM-dependent methyltransferase
VVREFLGRAYNRAVQVTLVPGILDTQCGAKAARTELWHRVLPHCRELGFAWDVEIIAVAQQLQIPVLEIAIDWHHDDRSRVHVLRDGMRMVGALPRIGANVRAARVTAATPRAAGAAPVPDDTHWWFRSKGAYVGWALRKWRPAPGWLVDFGGGAGGVTVRLAWPHERTLIVDRSLGTLDAAARRYAVAVACADVAHTPLAPASATVVCLLDVIEHLDAPHDALAEARRVLVPGGRVYVHVPAHTWLWSSSDEALGHRRRYTTRTLRAELEQAGFEVEYISHVYSWLVAPMWALRRGRSAEPRLGLDVSSPLLDRVALVLTRIERMVAGRYPLPVGTSILCVARSRA